MKKLVFIFVLAFTLQISAQSQVNWITDNTTAIQQASDQNKPILVYVTDNQKTQASERLSTFFSNGSFEKFNSKVVWLKLDISDKQSYNVRLGIHYTKQTTAPGLSLIDNNGNTVLTPLTNMTDENIMAFLTLMNDKLK
ncbi:hypothetical protein [uncultured Psychroserpens sp.]|uniref:hypothetical protein n=1 Tax=uncultured Psychroserpens sp. TaxID=255436 RepID=UPI0026321F93|nr:hypothetical protein [uncultured Psychroserpens sp.]